MQIIFLHNIYQRNKNILIKISLKEFILTGLFGPVKLGMTKEEVIKHLGEPDCEGDYNKGFGGLVYSRYEFFYNQADKIINGIQNDHLMVAGGNKKKNKIWHKEAIVFESQFFYVDLWFLRVGRNFNYEEVVDILKKDDISFELKYNQFIGHYIQFDSGVYMDFQDLDDTFFCEKESPKIALDSLFLSGIRLFESK